MYSIYKKLSACVSQSVRLMSLVNNSIHFVLKVSMMPGNIGYAFHFRTIHIVLSSVFSYLNITKCRRWNWVYLM